MYQFVRRGDVAEIRLNLRDVRLLGANGWRFIYLPRDMAVDFDPMAARTCVDLSKRAIAMHAPFVQTPRALYAALCDMRDAIN